MKQCKEGLIIAEELSRLDLSKFTCNRSCYKCIYWGDNYCQANLVKGIIQKSKTYLESHEN